MHGNQRIVTIQNFHLSKTLDFLFSLIDQQNNSNLGMPPKKNPQKYGTLSQKVGGGPNRIPNFSHSSNAVPLFGPY